jgi:hypothetical protein
MGPYIAEDTFKDAEAAERQLLAARDAFPQWDLIETWSGFLAVPKGTEIVQAITLDALVGKIRQKEDRK